MNASEFYAYKSARLVMGASKALAYVRGMSSSHERRIKAASGSYGPAFKDGLRYVENLEGCGLRLRGFSHEIIHSLRHTGHYTDVDNIETCTGLVVQMPAKNGQARFLAGYWLSDACERGAIIDFSEIYLADLEDNESIEYDHGCDAIYSAARSADSLAEREAEKQREYNRIWVAGSLWRHTKDELHDLSNQAKDTIRKMRAVRQVLDIPNLLTGITETLNEYSETLENHLEEILGERSEKLRYMAEIANGDHNLYCFYIGPNEDQLISSFNDGAGETVLKVRDNG